LRIGGITYIECVVSATNKVNETRKKNIRDYYLNHWTRGEKKELSRDPRGFEKSPPRKKNLIAGGKKKNMRGDRAALPTGGWSIPWYRRGIATGKGT